MTFRNLSARETSHWCDLSQPGSAWRVLDPSRHVQWVSVKLQLTPAPMAQPAIACKDLPCHRAGDSRAKGRGMGRWKQWATVGLVLAVTVVGLVGTALPASEAGAVANGTSAPFQPWAAYVSTNGLGCTGELIAQQAPVKN